MQVHDQGLSLVLHALYRWGGQREGQIGWDELNKASNASLGDTTIAKRSEFNTTLIRCDA